MYDSLIVSDLHLGSPLSMAEELYTLLQSIEFKRLILLGDIFSDLNFSRLNKSHWKLLSYIRKLSNHKRGIEVVWVEGNHDRGIIEVMEHLIGVKAYERYFWEWNGKKCLAIHGHQFDAVFACKNPWWLDGIVTSLYLWAQKIKGVRVWLPKLLDMLQACYQRLPDKVATGAIKEATKTGASYVFCGHTHEPVHLYENCVPNPVHYFNSGCWVSGINEGTYLVLDKEVHQMSYDLGG